MTFAANLKQGRKAEAILCDILERAGIVCAENDWDRKEKRGWDFAFLLRGRQLLAEVKHDLYEAKTGNVAVEYHNPRSGEPTGILTTKSHLWGVVLADGSVWACATRDLLDHFHSRPCVRDVKRGGDGNADFRLYNRAELFGRMFVRLDDLPAADVKTILAEILD